MQLIVETILRNRSGVPELCGGVTEMNDYNPKRQAGKICYYVCGWSCELPLRDVLNECGSGYKKEPNYETGTYNFFTRCNQRSLIAAVKRGDSHLIFMTRYHGSKYRYQERYFITGVWKIGWTGMIEGRICVKASEMLMTTVEDAFVITPKNWKLICPTSTKIMPVNLRGCTQVVKGEIFQEICDWMRTHDSSLKYLCQIKELNR